MKKLSEVFGSDPVRLIGRSPHGPKILALGWLALHVLLIYELIAGKMQLPWRFEWVEGRESSPVFFWLYIAGFAGGLLLVDFFWLRAAFSEDQKKGRDSQRSEPTSPSGHGPL